MCNNCRTAAGASKVSKTHITTSALGLLNPRKCQCMHQEQEVYHCLYKDKLEKLAKEALDKRLPELLTIPNGSEDEDKVDSGSDGNNSPKDRHTEPSSTKKIRSLRMKICREVRVEAWANETEEVRHQVKEEMMREKDEFAEINGEEGKVGLEQSPELRAL